MPFRSAFAILLAVAGAAALSGPARAEGTDAAAPADQAAAPVSLPAISVMRAAVVPLRDRVLASGQIGPVDQVYVQPQIEGQVIEAILADIGDWVEKDQVLVELSGSALGLQKSQLAATRASAEASIAQGQAQLVEAQATYDEARRVWDRTQKLRAAGTVSEAAADQAEAAAASAKARVTVAEQGMNAASAQVAVVDAQIADADLNLGRTSVRAPVAGRIVERNAQVGAIGSAAGGSMFVIDRDGLLELRADVAEQDVLRLAPGQTVTLRVIGLATPLTGKVRLVEPSVDATTRLGRVRVALDAGDRIVSGLFAEAEILVDAHDGIAVPVSAVSNSGTMSTVLTVGSDGKVARKDVTTGIRDGGMVEITKGLTAGEFVVAKAGAFVRDGDRIHPVEAEPAQPASN
jgi:HlyD family secretion protein